MIGGGDPPIGVHIDLCHIPVLGATAASVCIVVGKSKNLRTLLLYNGSLSIVPVE